MPVPTKPGRDIGPGSAALKTVDIISRFLASPFLRPAADALRKGVPTMITTEQIALEVLAGCPQGITDGMLIIKCLDLSVFDDLVERGLASAAEQRHANPNGPIVTRYWITDAGRKAVSMPLINSANGASSSAGLSPTAPFRAALRS
jgi:hypothetical protein